jgi:hypothetical protein
MLEPEDQPLERTPDPAFSGPPPPSGPPMMPVAIIGGLIVLFIAGGAWWMAQRPDSTNATPAAVAATEAPATSPEAETPLPPLDQMDAFLRQLLSALSNRPELANWLATDGLVQQLAAAIDQASQGKNPARDFKVLAPATPLGVGGRGNRRTIDANGYRRYDGLVGTVTSMDAAAVARIYRTIRPRLNEAYRNMGRPDGDVDAATRQAIDILLETPVVQGPVVLVEGAGASWAFADPKLEALTSTQKQLVRMGPAHTEAMLEWLQALKAGLGE